MAYAPPESEGSVGRQGECPSCGARFSDDARFCPFDGERLVVVESDLLDDPRLGLVVDGRYEIISVLGQGGMGSVYEARHVTLGRPYALKVLRRALANEEDLARRFIREAKAAASVEHPNVVQITDFGRLQTGEPYFVMERLTGETLADLLEAGVPLAVPRVVSVLAQVSSAIAAAHRAGVVHRDLKPENIQLEPNREGGPEHVKVLDFGLAQVAGKSRLTKGNIVFGTPHYMSPEQASGATVDLRSDIYTLGVVAYQCLTGRLPFDGASYMEVMTQQLCAAPVPLSQLRPELSGFAELEGVVLRCLEKAPAARYQSMDELLGELRRIAKRMGVSVELSDPLAAALPMVESEARSAAWRRPEPIDAAELAAAGIPRRGGRAPLALALGLLLVAAGAVLALWLQRSDATRTIRALGPEAPTAQGEPAAGPPAAEAPTAPLAWAAQGAPGALPVAAPAPAAPQLVAESAPAAPVAPSLGAPSGVAPSGVAPSGVAPFGAQAPTSSRAAQAASQRPATAKGRASPKPSAGASASAPRPAPVTSPGPAGVVDPWQGR